MGDPTTRSAPRNAGRRVGNTTAERAASGLRGNARTRAAQVRRAVERGAGRGLRTRAQRTRAVQASVRSEGAARRRRG